MSRLRKTIIGVATVAAGIGAALLPAIAAISSDTGLVSTGAEAGYGGGTSLPTLVGGIIQGLMALMGMLFLLLIMYAGITWMTAQGADDKIKRAKTIIMNATVGLVLTFASYAIAGYVIQVLTTTSTSSETPQSERSIESGVDPTDEVFGGCPPDDPLCNVD